MLWRRVWHRGQDALFASRFSERYFAKQLRGVVTCLLYHRVDAGDEFAFLTRGGCPCITPQALQADLQFFQQLGVRFMTFAQLRAGEFPRPDEIGVIVSFDDCFLDNYEQGLAILRDMGILGVFFQTAGMLARQSLLWEHALYWWADAPQRAARLQALARDYWPDDPQLNSLQAVALARYLRDYKDSMVLIQLTETLAQEAEAELRQLAERIYPDAVRVGAAARAGHEIGSHGHQHLLRKNVSAEAFACDLAESVAVLQAVTGEAPGCFSYPFSSTLPGDTELCQQHFAQAAIVRPGRIRHTTPPYVLPRCNWPGPLPNARRLRRWRLTGIF